jgi:hypothetical protein
MLNRIRVHYPVGATYNINLCTLVERPHKRKPANNPQMYFFIKVLTARDSDDVSLSMPMPNFSFSWSVMDEKRRSLELILNDKTS